MYDIVDISALWAANAIILSVPHAATHCIQSTETKKLFAIAYDKHQYRSVSDLYPNRYWVLHLFYGLLYEMK